MPGESFQSRAEAVGHPEQSLTEVRGTDAVCAQYDMPEGVAFSFHVSTYSIEPTVSNRAFNLLTKDCVRATLADEAEECGPEVSLVIGATTFSCDAERLTGTGPCPDWPVCGPACELESETPSGYSCKKVTLGISFEFMWLYVCD